MGSPSLRHQYCKLAASSPLTRSSEIIGRVLVLIYLYEDWQRSIVERPSRRRSDSDLQVISKTYPVLPRGHDLEPLVAALLSPLLLPKIYWF